MATRILKFDNEAQEKLQTGIDKLTKAVAVTLGPKGRNVAIEKTWGAPAVIHDGVTVAKEVNLEDPFENMGAQLLKEAASKTNDLAGDGTTTATILAQAIITEGLKAIQEGANPMILKKGIEKAVLSLVKELEAIAKKISTPEEIAQVATISAADSQIGQLIADALDKVGKDGIVTVEESQTSEMVLDYKGGMQFDKGYASPYLVTDQDKMEASIGPDPYILVTDMKVANPDELLPFLNGFVANVSQKNLVVIADVVEGEALAMFILNKLRGVISVLAVNAPSFGDRRKEILEDMAILTGATLISHETGKKFQTIELSDLGRATKVTSTKENTMIIGGKGKPEKILERVNQIRNLLESAGSDFEKEKLQERLARLTGGAAVVCVGAMTEIEMKEKKERVIDAVAATKAAIDEGIVPGGEVSLLRIGLTLKKVKALNKEEKLGIGIVKKALEQPFRQLMLNAGLDAEKALADIIDKGKNVGIDVLDGQVKDLIKAGIIDPVKVTRLALQNAASVAVMVMTSACLMAIKPVPPNQTNSN